MSKKAGDWDCPNCQHLNFSRRESCQRCQELRPAGGPAAAAPPGPAARSDAYSSRGAGYGYRSSAAPYGSGRSYGGSFSFGTGDVRPGDWYCSAGTCNAHNFASRNNCFRCGAYKDESLEGPQGGYDRGPESGGRGSRSFGFGSSFNSGGGGARLGWKSGDWICTRSGCNEHNFASRIECFRCNAPREADTEM